ncbi:MAG: dehydrogenase E1 component subunit alpha/beta [Verrucomicrobiae bacterium]|nr:dehydrogenase E1 component subunit alpha/beta [Verrucomicrobiae bacterium]MDW8343788.1 dehydrogenase E1 component subunit alpha/beta [Verrucomicrobiae bacterium]
MRPRFEPYVIDCGEIPAFQFKGRLRDLLAARQITAAEAVAILEDMLIIREFEEMIVKLRSGAYTPLPDFNYRGPTHVSIGQEGCAVGACAPLTIRDKITSTHRGHGESLAKGTVAIRAMTEAQLRQRVPHSRATTREQLIEEALEEHLYRTICELFGKDDGYCRGRGGSMHIADFTVGHLGANAIVGGGTPIATGAAMALRYLREDAVVCCFAGDGAFSNGVALESLNWATQQQFTNHYAGDHRFGLPIIFLVINNHYGMTHRTDDEVTGIERIARRAAGFADNNMHAEVVNGMDVLAVRDAVQRAMRLCKAGQGPVFLDVDCYRYFGHSLSDPRVEYRTKEEEAAWRAVDPIETFKAQLREAGVLDEAGIAAIEERVRERNARAAKRAAAAADPAPQDVLKFMYTDTRCDTVPAEFAKVEILQPLTDLKRVNGQLTYKDAIREALYEEMARDRRVIFYGEDVADYGGAFKVTKGLLEAFGRERVFNTPISEACICGTAVGAAMVGLRPVVELMYFDFALMSSDQISNQAAKWHYMSGAQTEVPLVYRVSAGAGKGYGGQHSQTLEAMFCHIPGLYVVYPATPADAKGLLKSAIRDNNPVLFIESQGLYGMKGPVPEGDYLVPIGVANVLREGSDLTFVAWGPVVHDCLKAAEKLKADRGVSCEVIDLRSLVPLDLETVLRSVQKTGRCVVASQAVHIGSYTGEIASAIQEAVFDYLDAPVKRVGAKNGIAPQSHVLEAAFLPSIQDLVDAATAIL